jgi:prepilin-type N-terminal cleavage/methylation domain-containing protein
MIQILSIARSPRNLESRNAFTLIELLIAVGIAAILGSLAFTVMRGAARSGEMAQEVNAGKTLITAYLNYAAENNGQLMVAHYEGKADALDNISMTLPSGEILNGGALHRYPFRLSAYFNHKIEGTILVNQNRRMLPKVFSGNMSTYGISLCPSFGINYYFAGGHMVDNEIANPSECVLRLAQSPKPAQMLIFATAVTPDVSGTRIEGRFGVEPPAYKTALWDGSLHVDPRHGGEALCAFLDGSVRRHGIDELRDMRYWSPKAQLADNANYRVETQGSSGLGGSGGGGRR